jgi:BirA family biotin operon repressor/biotin-[acetyl-CoA-carboxylase] ligase
VSRSARALDEECLRGLLRGEEFVQKLVLLDTVSSTNDIARDLAAEGAGEGTVVLAERQTAGRGRMGRFWDSPRGLGLYVSVLFRPPAPAVELTRWTLGAGVAACEACRQRTGTAVEIEWPNDLVWSGKKLGGVLAEMRTAGEQPTHLVIGAGLNVGQDVADFPDELFSTATSLRLAGGGVAPQREPLVAAYLRELAGIARALGRDAWGAVAQRWEALAPRASGRRVRVTPRNGKESAYEGITMGVDDVGALRVRRPDGDIVSVRLAESVVPLEV